MKRHITFTIFITIYCLIYCQREPKKFIHWRINNVIINSQDSSYKYAQIANNHGAMMFVSEGVYIDTIIIDTIPIAYKLRSGSDFKNIIQIKKSEYISDVIDTVKNYFCFHPVKDTAKYKDEVKYSYILQLLNEQILWQGKHNVIRIIEPLEDLNICIKYLILQIHIFPDSAKIFKTTCKIKGFEGIQVTEKDSFLLKKRHVKNLRKHINEVRSTQTQNKECRDPGNPYILEYNFGNEYDNFIFSRYCLRENRSINADEVRDLVSYIGTLRIKYFGRCVK